MQWVSVFKRLLVGVGVVSRRNPVRLVSGHSWQACNHTVGLRHSWGSERCKRWNGRLGAASGCLFGAAGHNHEL